MNLQRKLIEVHNSIESTIEESGFTLMCINQCVTESDENFVPFFYTIGLTRRGLPELFLSGALRPQIVNVIFHDLIDHWAKNDNQVTLGITDELLKGKDDSVMRANLVPLDVNHLSLRDNYAVQLFQHYEVYYPNRNDIQMIQLVWPDTEGRLPMEPGFSMGAQQILLPQAVSH